MHALRILLLMAAASTALTACAKTSESSNASSSPAASAASSMAARAGNGAKVYATNCASCHQADGKGMPGAFPPLADNPLVVSDPKFAIHIVKFGLTGKIDVQGHAFNGMMPPWESQLSDRDIADVITYVRSSWGNSAPPVTQAQVSAIAK